MKEDDVRTKGSLIACVTGLALTLGGCSTGSVSGGAIPPDQQTTIMIGTGIAAYPITSAGFADHNAASYIKITFQEYDLGTQALVSKGRTFTIFRSCPAIASCDLRQV